MLTRKSDDPLALLETGPLFRFADWPEPSVPKGAAGLYSIWRGPDLLYVGMAKQGSPETSGLYARLRSHASGRRGADQFCLYVFDRLVLPTLTVEDIADAVANRISLDQRTRAYVRENLDYRCVAVNSTEEAEAIEREARGGALKAGLPFLNPLSSQGSRFIVSPGMQ